MNDFEQASRLNAASIRVNANVKEHTRSLRVKAGRAIFWAGLICGVLDIAAAFVNWGLRGVHPLRLLQAIASGLLGAQAFDGGWPTALLGLACHFFIAYSAATVFYVASRKWVFLTRQPYLAGITFGVAVYLVMNWVVLPLSRVHRAPFSLSQMVIAVVTHMVCVGLPIAFTIRRYPV